MCTVPPNCEQPAEIKGYAWIAFSDLEDAQTTQSDTVMLNQNAFSSVLCNPGNMGEIGIMIRLRGGYVLSPINNIKLSSPNAYVVNFD